LTATVLHVGAGDDIRRSQQFFDGCPDALLIYDAVEHALHAIGDVAIRVTKSQIAFRRRRGFAYLWRPGQYVASSVPAVLTIALPHEVHSDRFKSVVHPSKTLWMHHIEIHEPGQIDDEVRGWLAQAFDDAG
jgi:hypothetical protein